MSSSVAPEDRDQRASPPASPEEVGVPVIRIRAARGWTALGLGQLWACRELLYFLIWRDIKVRYKQTALGVAWAILQPLLTMLIFTLFFGRLAKIASDDLPYSLFCFTALVPWTFFANGLTQSSNSLVGSANLITKVFFPRLAIPLASVISGLVDLGLGLVLVAAMMAYYGVVPSVNILWAPLFLLLALATCLGAGLWLSALNVQFRDVRFAVPFLTQLWMFATPVAYPSSLLSEPWRTLFGLNPMTGVVEGLRWSLLDAQTAPGPIIAVSSAAAAVLMISGAYWFRRMEKTFADLV